MTDDLVDLSFLPNELRREAIRTDSGEFMWPRSRASAVVRAVASSGRVVLGLDLRSDGAGSTPVGLSTEAPWSALPPEAAGATPVLARAVALDALARPELMELAGYDWVLITWKDT